MKIAILGWGSLIWDPRDLPLGGTWQEGGPELPIEFSRVSRDARLTLVIDNANGSVVPTMHVRSVRTSLDEARNDLIEREETVDSRIGWVDIRTDADSSDQDSAGMHGVIRKWAKEHEYDAVVWTVLSSNFEKETGKKFSTEAAIAYLSGLPKNVRENALEYVRRAPKCVKTRVREAAKERFGDPNG
jgi:hypothetical protein